MNSIGACCNILYNGIMDLIANIAAVVGNFDHYQVCTPLSEFKSISIPATCHGKFGRGVL